MATFDGFPNFQVLLKLLFLSSLAPLSISFEDSSPGSLVVKMEPPEVGPSIGVFEAAVQFEASLEKCTATPSVEDILHCQINNLVQKSTPVLKVRSCAPGNEVCSDVLETKVVLRMFYNHLH